MSFVLPIVFYITLFGLKAKEFYVLMIIFNIIILKVVFSNKNHIIYNNYDEIHANYAKNLNQLELKIIKLSVNSFRTSVFIITSVAIIAVDFFIFPRVHAKTVLYGISLMDLGVGLFVLCHSMRVIRNPSDTDPNADVTIKRYMRVR
jgi:phosphatidylinositol glycan class W